MKNPNNVVKEREDYSKKLIDKIELREFKPGFFNLTLISSTQFGKNISQIILTQNQLEQLTFALIKLNGRLALEEKQTIGGG